MYAGCISDIISQYYVVYNAYYVVNIIIFSYVYECKAWRVYQYNLIVYSVHFETVTFNSFKYVDVKCFCKTIVEVRWYAGTRFLSFKSLLDSSLVLKQLIILADITLEIREIVIVSNSHTWTFRMVALLNCLLDEYVTFLPGSLRHTFAR